MIYIANDGKKIESVQDREDIVYYNIDTPPFRIHGVEKTDGLYRRMPESVARTVNSGVLRLHDCSAGGRIRFITDSPFVALWTRFPNRASGSGNMSLSGGSGFDMYSNTEFVDHFTVTEDRGGIDKLVEHPTELDRITTINMPPYNKVSEVYIGIKAGSRLLPAPDYTYPEKVVFYGSSVTQGGCASRPGMMYQEKLSRRFDFDYVNLGFSGSAKGEDTMAEYLASLDMGIFVYDYDHNADSTPQYKESHEPMFKKIRAAHPDMPILILTRPNYTLASVTTDRQEIASATFDNALLQGDKNVYYIPGNKLIRDEVFADERVDRAHPTDLGFHEMAKAMETTFVKMLSDLKLRKYLRTLD